jgi:hypothetical protein
MAATALTVRPRPALVHLPHPLLTAGRRLVYCAFRPGESISAYLERQGIRFGTRPVVLYLNDVAIPRPEWAATFPRTGQLIVVRAALAGGGDGGDSNKTLRTILSIAVLVFAPSLGASLGGALGVGKLAGTALVLIGGNLLVNALAPPPNPLRPGADPQDSPTYSLAGAANRLRPYEPLPLVLGRHRMFPDLGAKFYTEFRGDDQYLYGLFHFGLSDVVLSDMKIGNTPLSEFQDVETEESGPDGKIVGFPANVDSLAGAALTFAAGFIVRTSSANATALAVDIEALLFASNPDGIGQTFTYLELEFAPAGSGSWAPLMDEPVLHVARWQPATLYGSDVRIAPTVFNGHVYRQVTLAFDPQRETIDKASSVSGAVEPVWPTGAGATIVDNGATPPTTWQEDGTISAALQYFFNSTRKPIRRTFRRAVASGQYDVRVRKVTDTTDPRVTSEFVWSTLRTYQPDTADYTGQKRLGLIVRASGQLQGTIDQFNAVAEARAAVWTNQSAALTFDGVDDIADCGNGSSLQLGTGDASFEVLFVPTKNNIPGAIQTLIVGKGGGAGRFWIFQDGSNNLRVNTYWGGANDFYLNGATPGTLGERYHIVMTCDRDGLQRCYVNGVQTDSVSMAAAAAVAWDATTNLQFSDGIFADRWGGHVLLFRELNRVISAAEVAERYAGHVSDPTETRLDLRFDDGAGLTVTDYSGFKNHGAITGAAWATPTWTSKTWLPRKTSNPAWLFLWLARGKKLGGRRAFGGLLPDSRIDLDNVKDFGAWCDQKSLTFNAVHDRNLSVGELLHLIAHTGRGASTWASGRLGVVWDAENQPAVAVFGMGNIKRNSFAVQYLTGKIADEIVVRFVNPANDWLEETVRRTVPGVTNPERPVEYPLFGCTNEVMAGRAANLLAAQQVHRLRRISWECDLEAAPVQRGNVVTLSHDLTQWGYSGRIVNGRLVTNLLLWPEAFDNAVWNNQVGVTRQANTHGAPDGTLTADTLTFAAGASIIGQSHTWSAVLTGLTFSDGIYLRADTPTTIRLGIGRQSNNPIDAIVCNLTTVWQRFNLSHTFASTVETNVWFDLDNDHDSAAHVIQVWGAMLNFGAALDTYVRNTTAIVPKLVARLDRLVPFFEDPLNPGQAEPQFAGVVFPNQFYQVFDVAPQLPGEHDQLVLDEAWPADDGTGGTLYTPDTDPGHPPYDYKYLFDPKATPGKLVKILAMQPLNEHYVRLVATDETPDYYASEDDPYDYTPPSDFTAQIPTIVNLEISDTLILSSGVYATIIALDLTIEGRFGSASIAMAPQGQPLQPIGRTFERSFEFQGPAAGTLDIEVIARAPDGRAKAAGRKRVTYDIVGKDRRPQDVAFISASQNGPVVVIEWGRVADVDVIEYPLRYGIAGIAWENATVLPAETAGRGVTTAALPPGDWDLLIKAKDSSGLLSFTAARTGITVVNELDIIFQHEQAPDWLGVLDGFVPHWTGVLVPDSTKGASAHTNAELFEQFVPYPVALCRYTTPEIDIGFDDNVRVWAQLASAVGRGQNDAGDKPALEIDFRLAAGSYDGFEPWSIGDREFRFLKQRAVYAPQVGAVRMLTGFIATTDLLEDTIVMKDQVIAPGGSTLTYPRQFHVVPAVEVIPKGAATRIGKHLNDTTTQTTVHLMDLSDISAGGDADVHLTGV